MPHTSMPSPIPVSASPAPVLPTPRVPVPPLDALDVRPLIRQEPLLRKVGRRLLTFPVAFLFVVLWTVLLPVAVPLLAGIDLVRGRPTLLARFYLAIFVIVFGQAWGAALLAACWLFSGFGYFYQANNRWTLACESYWAGWNKRWLERVYANKYDVTGDACIRDGASILLVRHASILDTIAPISLLTTVHGVRLRIVLKAELLFAPIVDAIGHRLPIAFVKRQSGNTDRELDAVRTIGAQLHPNESVMIFPEGTRFTTKKRERLIAKLQDRDAAAAARATELHHVMPLRMGGIEALLQAAPDADVVIAAHTGYEDAGQLEDMIAGGLYRKTIRFWFWRIPRATIPADAASRVLFFHNEWRKVDAFVAKHQARSN